MTDTSQYQARPEECSHPDNMRLTHADGLRECIKCESKFDVDGNPIEPDKSELEIQLHDVVYRDPWDDEFGTVVFRSILKSGQVGVRWHSTGLVTNPSLDQLKLHERPKDRRRDLLG